MHWFLKTSDPLAVVEGDVPAATGMSFLGRRLKDRKSQTLTKNSSISNLIHLLFIFITQIRSTFRDTQNKQIKSSKKKIPHKCSPNLVTKTMNEATVTANQGNASKQAKWVQLTCFLIKITSFLLTVPGDETLVEVRCWASFLTCGLKKRSHFWSSLEDVSSSNRGVKSCFTFKK